MTKPPPPRGPVLIQAATIAGLSWVAAELLGIPDLLGIPFLPLLPLAALAGAVVTWAGAGRLVNAVAVGLVAAILLVGFTPLIRPGVQGLIVSNPVPTGGVDAIIVLSAAVSRDSLLTPGGAERLLHAVELLHAGHSRTIVTSRVRSTRGRVTITSDSDQARLVALAPDSVRWLVIDSVATTRDEATQTAAAAPREHWQRVAVVTSPLHTRRACAAFRKAGLTVTCVAAPSRGVAVHSLNTATDRVAAFGPWLYETVGWWWYRVKGWV